MDQDPVSSEALSKVATSANIKIVHQCHIASTTAPVGPVNVSILG